MRCPTCGKSGLIITAKICPRCDTQLTSDYDLDDAPELLYRKTHSLLKGKVVELARRKEKLEQRNSRLVAYLTISLLIILSSLVLKRKPTEALAPSSQTEDSLRKALLEKSQSLSALEQEILAKRRMGVQSKDSIYYVIQPGDNLTKISRLFYNEDSLLFEIVGRNNISIPDRIIQGDTLTIYFIK